MATPEITIRGAGIFGLSIAWFCAARGARVQVIDPYGAGSGASGGIVGALAPHVPENWNDKKAFQLKSLLGTEAFWKDVDTTSGLSSGYGRTGRLQPLADQASVDLAHGRVAGAKAHWGHAAEWCLVSATSDAWRPLSPTGAWIHDTLTARLHPGKAIASLVAALGRRDVPIRRDGAARGLVVHATGWQGLRDLGVALGHPVGGGVKGQAVLLKYAAPHRAPQIFADGLHIIPHDDGTVAIGSTSERNFDAPVGTDLQADALVKRARAALPCLEAAPEISRWAGVRPRAKSRAPILGPWPGRDGHFVANGGFKIGFGMAVGVAEILSDLILDGRDRIPDAFRVEANLPL